MIENIPNILQYIVPGIISIIIFTYFASVEINTETKIISSCVISFLLLAIVSIAKSYCNININNALIDALLASVVGIILSILFCYIYVNKKFSKLTSFLFHKTPHKSIWRDEIDFKKGVTVKVCFKDRDYYIIGAMKHMEEKGEDSWFSVSGYQKYNVTTKQVLDDEPSFLNDHTVSYVFRLSDVEHMEILSE